MTSEIKQRIEQINNGQVPEGYKKTEFGVFPCDWVTKRFGEVCDIYSGGTPNTSVSEYWNGDIPWCTPTDIGKSQKYIFDTEKKITELGLQKSSAVLMPTNSIIMCSRATVGPRSINKVPMATNQGFKNLICKTEYNTEFIYHYIDVMLCCLISKSSGSTFLELSKTTLEKMICTFPKITEQEKIAEILMKWDEAIELQEKYIEKLKVKKDAIMHKLLVPKPNWKTIKLGDICNIKTGKLNVNDSCETGKYPFFSCSKDVYNIDSFSFDCEALLIAGNGDIGDIKYYKGKFDAYQRTYVLTDFSFDIQYVMQYLLFHFDKEILKGIQKSSMPYIKLNSLKTATIKYDENNYIQVQKYLFEFEKSIALNKSKLDNLCFQRKALQQYLLNGIVRVEV